MKELRKQETKKGKKRGLAKEVSNVLILTPGGPLTLGELHPRKWEILAVKTFRRSLPSTKFNQAKYFVVRIIRYISHVYVSSKSHSDEN